MSASKEMEAERVGLMLCIRTQMSSHTLWLIVNKNVSRDISAPMWHPQHNGKAQLIYSTAVEGFADLAAPPVSPYPPTNPSRVP